MSSWRVSQNGHNTAFLAWLSLISRSLIEVRLAFIKFNLIISIIINTIVSQLIAAEFLSVLPVGCTVSCRPVGTLAEAVKEPELGLSATFKTEPTLSSSGCRAPWELFRLLFLPVKGCGCFPSPSAIQQRLPTTFCYRESIEWAQK